MYIFSEYLRLKGNYIAPALVGFLLIIIYVFLHYSMIFLFLNFERTRIIGLCCEKGKYLVYFDVYYFFREKNSTYKVF